ncbi:APA family fibronectin-binding glycoprotein, partial [Mycobacterium attenuatum]
MKLNPPTALVTRAGSGAFGSALLSKATGEPPMPGQAPPVANDTRI